jgi:PAS domain S-box-containing protein
MTPRLSFARLVGGLFCAVLLLALFISTAIASNAPVSDFEVPMQGTVIQVDDVRSVWKIQTRYVIFAAGLITLETVLIGILLVQRSRRRRTNEHIVSNQQQLSKTFQFNPQPMSLTTVDEGRFLDVNDAFLKMSGYTRDEVIGRTSIDLSMWNPPEQRAKLIASLSETGSLSNIESWFRTKDGSYRFLFSSVECLTVNGRRCFLVAASDITERKLAEDRFRRFFDLPLVGMAITSATRQFLLVNQKLCQMLGYSAEELTSMKWTDVTHPDDIAENARLLQQTLRGETEGYIMDKRFIHRDGRVVHASISARCVREDDGSVEQLVLIVQDITERKEAEHSLAELTGRLLRSQDEERRRIARELHDVTAQGVGLILLNLAQVQKAITSAADPRSKDRLSESIALGEQALKEIRTLSYVLHPPLLDHAGLVTALRWYIKGFTERSGVKVGFIENCENGHRMPEDVEHSLFRVVQECLTNIRRHTNSESADISLIRDDENVILQVRDYGVALVAEPPHNSDSIEGLGVGIPGMRQRMKQLGGGLEVDSGPEGTIVTATVPVKWRPSYDSHSSGG